APAADLPDGTTVAVTRVPAVPGPGGDAAEAAPIFAANATGLLQSDTATASAAPLAALRAGLSATASSTTKVANTGKAAPRNDAAARPGAPGPRTQPAPTAPAGVSPTTARDLSRERTDADTPPRQDAAVARPASAPSGDTAAVNPAASRTTTTASATA